MKLWDQASWSGILFVGDLDNTLPPVFGLIFGDQAAAEQIFDNWAEEIGPYDEDDQLRVTIIQGISKSDPFDYRVVIGPNPITTR